MMMNPLFLNKRIAASSWRPECSDYSECSVKKAINPTYAQLIVLQKFKGFFIYNMLHCLIFAGYVILSIFLGFVCVFLAIIFKYAKIFLSPEMWNAYKQRIIAFL